jgi:hypothetical protein
MPSSKNNGREVYHVLPNASGDRWVVSQENTEFKRLFDTKGEAEKFAKERAQVAELGQVKIHGKDGNMEYEATYGEDPRQYPS